MKLTYSLLNKCTKCLFMQKFIVFTKPNIHINTLYLFPRRFDNIKHDLLANNRIIFHQLLMLMKLIYGNGSHVDFNRKSVFHLIISVNNTGKDKLRDFVYVRINIHCVLVWLLETRIGNAYGKSFFQQ